jgi:NADH-quinone oxidoreductase subunit L
MFRLWFMTFIGQPRDEHIYAHAHESPKVMYVPLVILAVFAVVAGWKVPFTDLGLQPLLEQARPLGTAEGASQGQILHALTMPSEHLSHAHEIHVPVTLTAFSAALVGFLVAGAIYWWRMLDADTIRRTFFSPIYVFLRNKWWFDELYQFLFVRPALRCAAFAAAIDRVVIDGLAHALAGSVRLLSVFDDLIDRLFVDGAVNATANVTYAVGLRLREAQTGRIRQYVMWVAVGTVGLFVLVMFLNYALAGQ